MILVVAVLGGGFDESSLSLHPFYRHRLATAFATRRVRIHGRPPVYNPCGPTPLTTHTVGGALPTFIYAAAANLNSDHCTPPGLSAVSFTMSSEWCGGRTWAGYRPRPRAGQLAAPVRDLSVQRAVAISGAVIASAMGRFAG